MPLDNCEGDSGGPVLYYSEQYRRWIIAGITSSGRACGGNVQPTVYTRVSVYTDWIQSVLSGDGMELREKIHPTVHEHRMLVTSSTNHRERDSVPSVSLIVFYLSALILSFRE